jgi:hypothetical protein
VEDGHTVECGRYTCGILWRPRHQDAVRRRCAIERLPQSPARQNRIVEIRCRHDQQVDFSTEWQMLEAIIEERHVAAELPFGQPSCQMAIETDKYWYSRERARKHLWLITRVLDRLQHTCAVTDDNHPVDRPATRVSAAQDGGPPAHLDE